MRLSLAPPTTQRNQHNVHAKQYKIVGTTTVQTAAAVTGQRPAQKSDLGRGGGAEGKGGWGGGSGGGTEKESGGALHQAGFDNWWSRSAPECHGAAH